MNLAHHGNDTTVEEHPLGQGGLARINVRQDPNVSKVVNGHCVGLPPAKTSERGHQARVLQLNL
jgi:hypothetical protein